MSKFDRYRTFVAIVEEGNLAAAAQALITSASSVSKQLSRLEQELGVQLLDRTTHTSAVTPAGLAFYHRAKDVLACVEEAEETARRQHLEPAGKLVIALPQVLLKTPLLALLQAFVAEYPGVTYDLKVSDTIDNLAQEKVDFALRIGELDDSRLKVIPLAVLGSSFWASPDYLAREGEIRFRELVKGHHLILPGFISASAMNKLLKLGDYGTFSRDLPCHIANDVMTMEALAEAGMGVAISFDISTVEAVRQGKLIPLVTTRKMPRQPLNLVYQSRRYLPSHMVLFKDFIKERFPPILESWLQNG